MKSIITIAGVATAVLLATPALADRQPTAAERTAIEQALRDAGYTSWEEVELDDDGPVWEIDDARRADGGRWDLKLAPNTYTVVEIDRED